MAPRRHNTLAGLQTLRVSYGSTAALDRRVVQSKVIITLLFKTKTPVHTGALAAMKHNPHKEKGKNL